MPERGHARLTLLLALADDELVMGHRHSEWTGWAPAIEADLAFSSIAQDEIAHAQLLYELAETLDGRDPDQLALGRHPAEYRHAVVCERPNGDWAYSLARQYLYDTADDVRLTALEDSSWEELAQAVKVIRLEERYHLDHAHTWLRRLVDHSDEAGVRLGEALDRLAGEAAAVFETLWEEELLTRDGVLPRANAHLREEWVRRASEELDALGLKVPSFEERATGGRIGTRSPDFAPLWEDLTGLYREHTGARW